MLDRSTVHLLWIFNVFIPLVLAGLYLVFIALPNDQYFISALFFLLGSVLGNGILVADDKLFYPKYNELQTLPKKLMSRSVVFILAFAIAALFIATSSGSSVGVGLVLGLGFGIWGEMVAFISTKPEFFQQRYLFQVKRVTSLVEQRLYVAGFGLLMLGLTVVAFS